jgi:WD40 repeat protein
VPTNYYRHRCGHVRELSYSPDGQLLAILSNTPDRLLVIRVADRAQWMDLQLPKGGNPYFNNARISRDNLEVYVSSGGISGTPVLRCLSLMDGQPKWESPIGLIDENEPRRGSDTGFSAMALSPDGYTLVVATGFLDSKIRVLDPANGRLIRLLRAIPSTYFS